MSVAGASVIARYIFLREMDLLGQRIGARIPLGAGAPVDLAARQIRQKHGFDIFKDLAKLHFKNYSKRA